MQIIVGVLLFTPLLFLLPTTAVYYVLALLLHTVVLVTCWGLEILDQLCQTIPLHTLWCWVVKPGMLPGELTSWCMLCLVYALLLVLPCDCSHVIHKTQLCSCTVPKMYHSIAGTLVFVSRPDLQTFLVTNTTSDCLTVLEMVKQPSGLGVHMAQWLTEAYTSTTRRLSISKLLQDVIMGRLVGCEAGNMLVSRLFGQHRQQS